MELTQFLNAHTVKEITIGQSGATVLDIDGTHILKHIVRNNLTDDLFNTYAREANFYKYMSPLKRNYLPEVEEVQISDDEIILLLKKYDIFKREEINDNSLRQIAETLAQIHLEDVPDFLEKRSEEKPLNDAELSEDFEGWKAVLEEHEDAFNIEPLEEIKEKVNRLITWHITETPVLTHGDFHLENLLTDSNGNILICDWQGVRCGAPSSDISFFISRLSADGITINNTHFLKSYADAILKLSGRKISINDISRHIAAANVITSYRFWHRFLHNNPEDRVREIYSAMTTDFHRIFPEEN